MIWAEISIQRHTFERHLPIRCSATIIGAELRMETANIRPQIFRGNWVFILLLIVFGLVLFATALGMVVLAITMAFPFGHYTFGHALNVFAWAFGALSTAFCGRAMWMQGAQIAYYVAYLDERGVDFRFGSKQNKQDIFFAWDQIATVQRKRSPAGKFYCVIGRDKRSAEFTVFTFFHPKKLAMEIAEHTGQPIQEIKL
jgi:hypothetical protein